VLARSLCLFALAGLACGGTDREDSLDRTLRARAEQRAPGNEEVDRFSLVARRGQREDGFRVILHDERCYAVLAVAEGSVSEVELRLFDPIGVAVDKVRSEAPIIEICAKRSGPYRVVLRVKGRGKVRAGVYERRR
jgi:hypothetical protein